MIFLTDCVGSYPGNFGTATLNQDYYFQDGEVQIQGEALLPGARTDRSYEPVPLETHRIPGSLSLRTRRLICTEKALINAQSKWLALTRKKLQDQDRWKEYLNSPERGEDLENCLKNTTIRRVLYDSASSCRVVAIVPCHPGDY